MSTELKPLADIIAALRVRYAEHRERSVRYWQEEEERMVKQVESCRLAQCLLSEAGFLPDFEWDTSLTYWLGVFGSTRAEGARKNDALLAFRRALDSRELEVTDQDVYDQDKGLIRYTLKPVEFPGITVRYASKPPKGSPCKVKKIRRTEYAIVCEAQPAA